MGSESFCQMYSWRTQAVAFDAFKLWQIGRHRTGEEEAPGKFLDRLRKALCRFTEIDPETEEGKVILKDRFLTQSAPDICCKLSKRAYGPNQSLDNLLKLAQTVYYGREYEEKKERQRKRKEKAEALAMAIKTVLKQPEKNAQRDPGEKGWACSCCGKEGHLKQDCPQASKPPPAPCPVCKGPQWRTDCPQRRGSQGSGSQDNQDWRFPGGPHTSSHPNYTWGIPDIDNSGRPICQFPFRYWSKLLRAYWSPWPTFFRIRFCNGTVWTSQKVLFQLFSILQLGFCAIFTRVSYRARITLTPFGEGYIEQGPCLCFHEYGALPFSPFSWTKCEA